MAVAELTRQQSQAVAASDAGLASVDWTALGTTAQLLVTEATDLSAVRVLVDQQLAAIDAAASRFRADSELSRLNAAQGRWTPISPLFGRVLRVARDAAAWTDGLVDPTIGGALIALGYDRTFVEVAADGSAGKPHGGPAPDWRQVELDEPRGRARIPQGVRIDVGATAKGLAADLCASTVASAFGGGVLVNLGGDICVAGQPPIGGWPVWVSDLSDLSVTEGGAGQTIALHGGALATSSTRARRWRRGGSQLHHLIDPRSGLPTSGPWRTVSVTAPTCALANTASTAAMVLGAGAADWLRSRGFSARLVGSRFGVVHLGRWPIEGEQS